MDAKLLDAPPADAAAEAEAQGVAPAAPAAPAEEQSFASAEDLESGARAKPTRCKCTRRRALVALGVAVVLLGGGFASAPFLVQAVVNGVPVSVKALSFSLPTATGAAAKGVLSAPCPVSATAAAGALELRANGVKLGSMTHGELSLGGDSPFEGTLTLAQDAKGQFPFVDLALRMVHEDVQAEFSGQLHLTLPLGMTATVSLTKQVTLAGLRGLPSTVSAFHAGPGTDDTVALNVTVDVSDPSFVGLDLGVVVLAMEYNGEELGQVTSTKSAAVMPGKTSLTAVGQMQAPKDTTNLSNLFSQYLRGEPSQLQARGVRAVGNDAKWLTALISGLTLDVVLPGYVGSLTDAASMPKLGIELLGGDKLHVTGQMGLETSLPMMTFPFTVTQAGGNGTVGKAVNLTMPPTPAAWTPKGPGKGVAMVDVAAPASISNVTALGALLATAMVKPSVATVIELTATMQVQTPLGLMTLRGLPVKQQVSFQGVNGLPGVVMGDFDVLDGTEDLIHFQASVAIPNPTGMSLKAQALPLAVYRNGVFVGNSLADPPELDADTTQHAKAVMVFDSTPAHLPQHLQLNQMVGRYVQGMSTAVTVKGDYSSPQAAPALVPALKALTTEAVLTGLPSAESVIRAGKMTLGLKGSQFMCQLANPWSSLMRFTRFSGYVVVNNLTVGWINHTVAATEHVQAPPKGAEWSSWLPVTLLIADCIHGNLLKCLKMLKVLTGTLKIDMVNATFQARMGAAATAGFPLDIVNYTQRDIPLTWR